MSDSLFWTPRFCGLPAEAFAVFDNPDRDRRRRAIVAAFHPPLKLLAQDLLERLRPPFPLHSHLPRLDWPRTYQPFCTWLVLSRVSHGYQSEPQLNVGVHADHVAIRLGWDTRAAAFGRFEFLALHGDLGEEMATLGQRHELAFRVYAAAEWPQGSRRVFESTADWRGAFAEVERRGVWFELGARYDVPAELELIGSAELGEHAFRIFRALLPLYDRAIGQLQE